MVIRPSSGAFLRSRTRRQSLSACHGALDHAERRQQLARPFAALQFGALTVRRCCCCSGSTAAAAVQVVAGAVAVAVPGPGCSRALHAGGSGQHRRAQGEFRLESRGGGIAG